MTKKIFVACLSLLLFASFVRASTTEELSDYQKRLAENQKRQQEIQEKINAVLSEERSLQGQISYMDNQISLTNLKIEEAQDNIGQREQDLTSLSGDIDKLIERIDRIDSSVKYQSEVLGQRIRARYINSRISSIDIFFGNESLTNALTQVKYLQVMAQQDKKLITQMNDTQDNYENQKDLLEKTKKQVEDVKAELEKDKKDLESRKTDLDFQKQAKEELLSKTKGKESEYNGQMAEIKAEQAAIEQAIANFVASLVKEGVPAGEKVEKGSIIGIQGSTGLSTGDHVHFGVYVKCQSNSKEWCHTNPKSYLDSGQLSWPLASYEVSQWYGQTPFAMSSGYYANNFHNGVDIYGPINSPVLAAGDGTISYSIDSYGGKGAIIYHSDSLMTLYWHIK